MRMKKILEKILAPIAAISSSILLLLVPSKWQVKQVEDPVKSTETPTAQINKAQREQSDKIDSPVEKARRKFSPTEEELLNTCVEHLIELLDESEKLVLTVVGEDFVKKILKKLKHKDRQLEDELEELMRNHSSEERQAACKAMVIKYVKEDEVLKNDLKLLEAKYEAEIRHRDTS